MAPAAAHSGHAITNRFPAPKVYLPSLADERANTKHITESDQRLPLGYAKWIHIMSIRVQSGYHPDVVPSPVGGIRDLRSRARGINPERTIRRWRSLRELSPMSRAMACTCCQTHGRRAGRRIAFSDGICAGRSGPPYEGDTLLRYRTPIVDVYFARGLCQRLIRCKRRSFSSSGSGERLLSPPPNRLMMRSQKPFGPVIRSA